MDSIASSLLHEQALVERALFEPSAFANLYDLYVSRVYTYVRYRVNDRQTAEDLTAQTFEQALVNLANFRPEYAPFSAWLFGIAHNVVSRHHRTQRRFLLLPLDLLRNHTNGLSPPEEAAVHAETQQQVVRAVARLRDRERDLIGLKFAAGLNNRQIATITGLSESNVGVILYRAIHQLRNNLKTEEPKDE